MVGARRCRFLSQPSVGQPLPSPGSPSLPAPNQAPRAPGTRQQGTIFERDLWHAYGNQTLRCPAFDMAWGEGMGAKRF